MLSQIAKASLRSELLIDFNCIVDTEIGMINLIKDKYLDDSVFNKDIIMGSLESIILLLIERKDPNPLYLFANDNIDRKDLDDYYREFMTQEYNSVLKYSITTGLSNLIYLFKTEPGIHVTFLCESNVEKQLLLSIEDFKECNIVLYDDNTIDFSQYSTYYFKYITDQVLNFMYDYKTYYFSKYLLNFDNEFNLIRPDIINKIIAKRGEVEIIDLYNKSYLEGEE
jgi:hypothetical protein